VLNAGQFGDSDTLWLYIFDANNDPLFSGNGFQITLGEGGGGETVGKSSYLRHRQRMRR
jgi:hypothetical protein